MNEFKIGRLRNKFFTKEQKNKLESGIEIFCQITKNPYFKDLCLQYNWSTQDGQKFRRFFQSNGLSNTQVFDQFQKRAEYFEAFGMKSTMAILPCDSRKDISSFKINSNPIIWISSSCLNNEWFTPVHVASAICHEIMFNLGFTSNSEIFNLEDVMNTVPFAFGKTLMLASKKWLNEVTDIRDSFDIIYEDAFNYFPSSSVFNMEVSDSAGINYQLQIDNMLGHLSRDLEELESLNENISKAEKQRMNCLNKVKEQLIDMKLEIINTSLDGSEVLSNSQIQMPRKANS